MKCNEYWGLKLNWKSELDLSAMTPVPNWRFRSYWNKSWWENQFSFWDHDPFFQESEHWVSTHDMESHSPGEHRQFFSWMVAHGTDVVKAIALTTFKLHYLNVVHCGKTSLPTLWSHEIFIVWWYEDLIDRWQKAGVTFTKLSFKKLNTLMSEKSWAQESKNLPC